MPAGMTSSALKLPSSDASMAFNSISKQQQQQAAGVSVAHQSHAKEARGIGGTIGASAQSMNYLQKSNYDAEMSDIDIEFKIEDDEEK